METDNKNDSPLMADLSALSARWATMLTVLKGAAEDDRNSGYCVSASAYEEANLLVENMKKSLDEIIERHNENGIR